MKATDFANAIKIISNHHNTSISINECVDNHVSNVYPILIHECCTAVINELVAAGYSLGMVAKGLSVDKF